MDIYYDKHVMPLRFKHVAPLLILVWLLTFLFVGPRREKIAYVPDKLHVVTKVYSPVLPQWLFSYTDTVMRDHIKYVKVTSVKSSHIHLREAGMHSSHCIDVSNPELYSVGEKVQMYKSVIPKLRCSIVYDRVKVGEKEKNGKKINLYKNVKQKFEKI
jgi:hypothetical protein